MLFRLTSPCALLIALLFGTVGSALPQAPAPQDPGSTGKPAEEPKAEEEAPAAPARLLADGELKKLAKAFGGYFEASSKRSGTLDALGEIEKVVEAIEKKLKGQPLIRLIPDLELAMIQAAEATDNVDKGKIAERSFTGLWKDTIRYAVHAPKSYRVKNGPYPLLVVIPAEGKDLAAALREQWNDAAMMENAIIALVGMPASTADWESIGAAGRSGGIANVLQVVKNVSQTYGIDPNRVIIAGHDRGAKTAIELASLYPHVFAGAIARAGDLGDTPPTNFGNLPVLLAGSAAKGTAFEEASKKLGDTSVSGLPSADLAGIWQWAAGQVRRAHPLKLRFAPGKPEARDAYWLSVEGFDVANKPEVQAEIDRANNLIRVTGQGVTHITLLLNDQLVDLSQPVRVVINGTEHEAKVVPNLRLMLDRAFNQGDRGRAYTATLRFEFTAAAPAAE
jgi:poly(3-hydroxybutyrate) depolymerase